jgi:predicted acyl esterase
LQNLAMTFLKGHQLRLDVGFSDYPHFDNGITA